MTDVRKIRELGYPQNLYNELGVSTDKLSKSECIDSINYIISGFKARDKETLMYRFKYGKTLDEISEIYGVSREQIRRILYRSFCRMGTERHQYILKNGVKKYVNIKMAKLSLSDKCDLSVTYLNVPPRIINVFTRYNIHKIGDLLNKEVSEIRNFRGMGDKGISLIVKALEEYGLSLNGLKTKCLGTYDTTLQIHPNIISSIEVIEASTIRLCLDRKLSSMILSAPENKTLNFIKLTLTQNYNDKNYNDMGREISFIEYFDGIQKLLMPDTDYDGIVDKICKKNKILARKLNSDFDTILNSNIILVDNLYTSKFITDVCSFT